METRKSKVGKNQCTGFECPTSFSEFIADGTGRETGR